MPHSEWKDLANRIEEITKGMDSLFPVSKAVETLAKHYAKLLSERTINKSALIEESVKAEYYNIMMWTSIALKTRTCETSVPSMPALSEVEVLFTVIMKKKYRQDI